MNGLLRTMEDRLFSARDTVCLDRARLVTEAWRRHEGEPMPLLRARVFEHLLAHMKLDLESNPAFAGNTSSAPRAWMLVPEFGLDECPQVKLEHSELAGILDGQVPEEIRSFWQGRRFGGNGGIGHMSLDFDQVVSRGLNEVLRRIDAHLDAGGPGDRVFREAMAIACRAVISWAGRYADEAERRAAACPDPTEKRCLLRVARACRHVPAEPARDLFEGLQAIALIHLASALEGQGMSMSVGLADRVLERFAAETEADFEEAVALVRAFLLKIAANSFLGRGSKTQTITVGGTGGQGDACNALTLAFLEAFNRTPVSDPILFLRWHEGLSPAAWDRAIAMLSRGRSMPLLANDAQVVPGLVEAGVDEGDARDYCIVGCNELAIPGRCCQSGFTVGWWLNDLEVLDRVVRSAADRNGAGQVSTGALLDGYEAAVADRSGKGLAARRAHIERLVAERPFPFCSTCCRSCVESGRDLLVGMPYPDIYGIFIRGTSNAVNALAAVEELVARQGRYRLAELVAGVDSRDQKVLAAIAAAPKWGNDDDRADRLGVELNRRRDRALRTVAAGAGLPPFTVCHVVRSLHHLDGRRIGATLDGRAAGEAVGDSIGAVIGTQTEGPTAMLNSVLRLDAARWFTGIYNLNLTLPAGAQAAPGVIGALAGAFFADGGQELQVNVLDVEQLRRAREHPELYRDLVVRVAGLNARFVELSALEQEELVRRAEAAAGLPGRGAVGSRAAAEPRQ